MQNGRSELHPLRFHLAQRRARGVIQHADWQCLLPPEGAGMCVRKPKVFTSCITRVGLLELSCFTDSMECSGAVSSVLLQRFTGYNLLFSDSILHWHANG